MSVPSLTRFRVCISCGLTKPHTAEFFYAAKRMRFGLTNKCIACSRAQNRAWMAQNKHYRREYNKKWEEENKERRSVMFKQWQEAHWEERREYNRAWCEQNAERIARRPSQRPEKRREYVSRYRESHPERAAESSRKWREANREYLRWFGRVYDHQRRTKKTQADGHHTLDEIWDMLESQEHVCAYCEEPLLGKFEIDHMIPVSREGGNSWANLAITCRRCNRSKRNKTVEEFLAFVGYEVAPS